MNEEEKRKKWKDERSQRKYGMSYASLCCDRKRVIDQLYLLDVMDKEEKAKGCR
jgi:hypothetical protein